MDVLISARGLSKRYPPVRTPWSRWTGLMAALLDRPNNNARAALEAVDLQVHAGESVAIVGENGAGKSTLLKLVAGVLRASDGTVETRGSIGALLELGAGFQPELTGRENARLSAMLMGAQDHQLEELLPRIFDFADIGDSIDEPVKHYSSGMAVRLGFAVIASLRPDLLITDEVLAVGDESFQKKCIRWLEDYLSSGGTLLLVSHSLYHVQKLCQRAIWLHQGRIEEEGDVFAVTQAYLAHHESRLAGSEPEIGLGTVLLEDVQIEIEPELAVRFSAPPNLTGLAVELRRNDDSVVLSEQGVAAGEGQNRLRIQADALLPGRYQLRLVPLDGDGQQVGPMVRRLIEIPGRSRAFGSISLDRTWNVS